MNRINDQLGLLGLILPDIYVATSVEDVNNSRELIERPSIWSLRNNISGMGYPGEVLIVLYAVNLHPESKLEYQISDLTSELLAHMIKGDYRIHPDSDSLEEISRNPGKYDQVYLLYQPRGGSITLYGAMRNTPESSKSFSFNVSEKLVLIPKLSF